MKYFYDTEFIEDGKIIDLISIGIVAEDGREYYAISTEFDAEKASPWVVDNVFNTLPDRRITGSQLWKSRASIKHELLDFIGNDKPKFWAYYADYDHVALCQLFGTMMDLPVGWPMYTKDIKQLCDLLGNPKLPAQGQVEHNALEDARWNKKAYEFLINYIENVKKSN